MGSKLKMYVDIMACHPEVTGSCFLCILKLPNRETTKFVVDCGLFQEEKHNQYNESLPFDCDNIDFVLLTHNHVDHTGRLPFLYKNGYRGKIYTSTQTKTILPLALGNSQKVLSDIYKRKHQKPLYTEKDVDMALNNTIGVEFNKRTEITPYVNVTFLGNGHLVGAAMILVEVNYPGEEPINLLFTGDYNNKNEFIDIPPIPEEVKDLRISVITESTYGATSVDEIDYNYFSEKVLEATSNNKSIVIPAFSLGRSQEVLYNLKKLQDANELDVNIPIYFDGNLAHAYTNVYLKADGLIREEMKNFLPENLTFVDCTIRDSLLNVESTKIIVTTSGMGTYGPAQIYIPYFVSRKQALILFTGYTAEGSVGSNLRNAEVGEAVKVCGLLCKKRADVSYCNQFSAHAKSEELIELLKYFNNLRAVLIAHGEEATKEIFAEKVLEEVDSRSVGILNRDYFFRLGSYGVEKTMSTRFE